MGANRLLGSGVVIGHYKGGSLSTERAIMLTHIQAYFAEKGLSLAAFPLRLHSPGRINIIGEHTDYTGGLVMPAAIDKGIAFYARPVAGRRMVLHAVDLGARYELLLPVSGKTGELWVDYLAGIIHEFQLLGHQVPALEVVFGGNVPRGSGMSSSAALEGGMAFLLNQATGANIAKPALARLCQRSSNHFIGVPTGIMDQFASLNGVAEGPILLNCSDLTFESVSANVSGHRWVLVNSMVTHELGSSEYPVRVRECAEALAVIRAKFSEVSQLSAATAEQLASVAQNMSPLAHQRAAFVVAENGRVRQMKTALEADELTTVGRLLNETHHGLSQEYDVSCPEVDFLQQQAVALAGTDGKSIVAGARLMGGGFGGCTLNLVSTDQLAAFRQQLTAAYRGAFDIEPEFYEVVIGPGTRLI